MAFMCCLQGPKFHNFLGKMNKRDFHSDSDSNWKLSTVVIMEIKVETGKATTNHKLQNKEKDESE